MPARKVYLAEDHFYHILNRGVDRIPLFREKRDYLRFLETAYYYQFLEASPRFSFFKRSKRAEKAEILAQLKRKLVDFVAYCLMPNHFHFVLKQLTKDGIAIFIRRLTNSYGKYFNVKYQRNGPLFQGRFRAVLVETDEQLLHLVRYVHLNPYASMKVRKINEIEKYPWSSFHDYLTKDKSDQLTKTGEKTILSFFKSKDSFRKFTFDQADYARKLEAIKHLALGEV